MFGIQLSAAAAQILVRVGVILGIWAAGFTVAELYEHRGPTPAPVSWVIGQSLRTQLDQRIAADKAAIDKARAVVAARDQRSAAISTSIAAATAASQTQIQQQTKVIHDQVPVYITRTEDAKCVITNGAVRLHDAAATGDLSEVSGPPAPADGAPSETSLSELLDVVTDNYGTCRADQDRLGKLQQWVRRQQAAAAAPVSQ